MSQPSDLAQEFDRNATAAVVLMVLTVFLIGFATTLSWWEVNSSIEAWQLSWYFDGVCDNLTCQSYQGAQAVLDAFGPTKALILSSLALSIVTLVLSSLSIFWPRIGPGTLIAGVIGSSLVLAAPLYLASALPGAVSTMVGGSYIEGFFGSRTMYGHAGSYTLTWGAGVGWVTAIVAFVLFIISSVLGYGTSRNRIWLRNAKLPSAQLPGQPLASHAGVAPPLGARAMFCPSCGSHYPAGTQFCGKDATRLKETIP